MKIHLVTVIGSDVKLLPHMLRHYRQMGIDSFLINVHLRHRSDPMLREIKRFTDEFGCGINSISVGEWSDNLNTQLYSASRKYPGDWYVLADLDEFQEYPTDLRRIIEDCETKGYDYIEGCFIDRVAEDGGFPEIAYDRPIDEQFPLGCTFTYSILRAYPLKVVAAKGNVNVSAGNHHALNGAACPITEYFAQVHHYKWVNGIIQRIQERANGKLLSTFYEQECKRFIEYFHANSGRINIADPRLLVSQCKPDYKHWDLIRDTVGAAPNRPGHTRLSLSE